MGTRNRRTKQFHSQFRQLSMQVQEQARKAFALFVQNPNHPSLELKKLNDTGRGRHVAGSYRVVVNLQYRAIFVVEGDTNVWYWIGTKNDCKNFTGVQG